MEIDMPMAAHMSKPKLEIEYQYDGRPFSESESHFISAVDRDRPIVEI